VTSGTPASWPVSASLAPLRLVTTDEVLDEVLAGVSSLGSHMRLLAAAQVRRILSVGDVEAEPQGRDTFLAGLELYEARSDKGYSLTDCVSMQTMRRRGLTEVLTHDHHFAQEGFTLLL
jgi:predicted nucleic acid-binding protein